MLHSLLRSYWRLHTDPCLQSTSSKQLSLVCFAESNSIGLCCISKLHFLCVSLFGQFRSYVCEFGYMDVIDNPLLHFDFHWCTSSGLKNRNVGRICCWWLQNIHINCTFSKHTYQLLLLLFENVLLSYFVVLIWSGLMESLSLSLSVCVNKMNVM